MEANIAPKAENALEIVAHPDVMCVYCEHTGIQIETHMWDFVTAHPLGSHSLAGQQMKVSATVETKPWQFARCLWCNHVSMGRY